MSVIGFDPMPAPYMPTRTPDLSGLTPSERCELRAFIARLQRGGGFDPKTITLVLDPLEVARLRELEGKVQWSMPMATTSAERPAAVTTGPRSKRAQQAMQRRRKDVTSDLVDAVERISLVLDCPIPDAPDPRTDPECMCRLERCTSHLTMIAARLEEDRLIITKGA